MLPRGSAVNKYDERHGGPYDRGMADSYYRRPFKPHYYTGDNGPDTLFTKCVEEAEMTAEEIEAYTAGYRDNEAAGYFKF